MNRQSLIIENLNKLNEAGIRDIKGNTSKDEFNKVVERHRLGTLKILNCDCDTPINLSYAVWLRDEFDNLLRKMYNFVPRKVRYNLIRHYYIQHCTDKNAFREAKKLWKKEKIHSSVPFVYVHLTFCVGKDFYTRDDTNKFGVDDVIEILTSKEYCVPPLQREYIQVINKIPIDKGSIKPVLYISSHDGEYGKLFDLRAVFDYFPEDNDI